MKRILLLAITIFLFFTNCTEKSYSWYVFAETQCANPWGTNTGDAEADVIAAVTSYLDDLCVDVSETTIESAVGQGLTCQACTCPSGRGIRVKADADDEAILLSEGFLLE